RARSRRCEREWCRLRAASGPPGDSILAQAAQARIKGLEGSGLAQVGRDEELDLAHGPEALVGRHQRPHSLLLHAGHDERVVREQAVVVRPWRIQATTSGWRIFDDRHRASDDNPSLVACGSVTFSAAIRALGAEDRDRDVVADVSRRLNVGRGAGTWARANT